LFVPSGWLADSSFSATEQLKGGALFHTKETEAVTGVVKSRGLDSQDRHVTGVKEPATEHGSDCERIEHWWPMDPV
jgi:hypothetical protein